MQDVKQYKCSNKWKFTWFDNIHVF